MDKFLSIVASALLLVTGTSTIPTWVGTSLPEKEVKVIVAVTPEKSLREKVELHIEKTFPEDSRLMKKIASCESELSPTAKSPESSASGIFQIIKGTWADHRCEGDPFNYEDNIECARKIYDGGQGLGAWSESFKCWKKTN